MKIAILGSGTVGQTLGMGFAGFGHTVRMGSRTPKSDKVTGWIRRAGGLASAGTYAEAAAFGQMAVLAPPWSAAQEVIRLAGPENLVGKTVIDVINPFLYASEGPPSLALGLTDSAGEQVQRWLPRSDVVKAFNIVGPPHMVLPMFPSGPPDMFICGNDSTAKETVASSLKDFGWQVVDIGGIEGARLLEPLALLRVVYGMKTGSWDHAFKLLRK